LVFFKYIYLTKNVKRRLIEQKLAIKSKPGGKPIRTSILKTGYPCVYVYG